MAGCSLCGGKGFVMVKEYQSDRWVKVTCSLCKSGKAEEEGSDSRPDKSDGSCGYCHGSGQVTTQASDGSPRICTCGHCHGSGREP